MSNKIITLRELKIKQEHVNSDLDNKGCVELKEIFFRFNHLDHTKSSFTTERK